PKLDLLEGHTGAVASAWFSRTGDRLASISEDGTARIWDVATGKSLARISSSSQNIAAVDFDDARHLIVTTDGAGDIWWWDEHGEAVARGEGNHTPGHRVSTLADGRVATLGWFGDFALWQPPYDREPLAASELDLCKAPEKRCGQ